MNNKEKKLKPWNVKPGDLIRLGVTETSSDLFPVVEVEKTRGMVTGTTCWRITYATGSWAWRHGSDFGSVLRFREDTVSVRRTSKTHPGEI